MILRQTFKTERRAVAHGSSMPHRLILCPENLRALMNTQSSCSLETSPHCQKLHSLVSLLSLVDFSPNRTIDQGKLEEKCSLYGISLGIGARRVYNHASGYLFRYLAGLTASGSMPKQRN